mgnify:CR=1 FL=1
MNELLDGILLSTGTLTTSQISLNIIMSLIITEFSQVSYFNPFLQLVLVLTWNMLRE